MSKARTKAKTMDTLVGLDPKEAANRLVGARGGHAEWLDAFAEQFDRRRNADALQRILAVWDLNQTDAARIFGVSRQAISKWFDSGVPAERAVAIADLGAATDLLVRHLKRDRVSGVVRRPAANLNQRSLLDLLMAQQFPRGALRLPGHVRVRRCAQPRVIEERLRDRWRWWRIAEAGWVEPLDPAYAAVRGGRWNPPASYPTLYLNEDVVTARLNLRRFIAGWPFEPEDLRSETGPMLVAAALPRAQRVCDAHTPEGLSAVGLPATYPLSEGGAPVPHPPCQRIGQAVKARGLRGCVPAPRKVPTGQAGSLRGFRRQRVVVPNGWKPFALRTGTGASRGPVAP